MALKLIPVESGNERGNVDGQKKHKSFNPGNKIRVKRGKNKSLKDICLQLVHFINRGSKFTYQQIDELIMGMQRSVLSLQQKKQEILKNKYRKKQ